ncbi:MAG: cation diffusion facilitator family transporter [Anaerolineales bacterium]|nr:cation diffusion facilitator family transporter [Anaerolineales bacterium]MCB9128000.1 cation diffusion facilitator family transporter [Ardenticatenales bacterium]MCB9172016.1 cation diffusion facilitator family transporter [Ardenticatenales bacterium]
MSDKLREALTSVAAATFLFILKLVVGLWSGSLGLLAEAINSALDILASVVTVTALRYADLPPDADHPYGHGKAENLGAFVQSGIMFLTCLWIGREALLRLIGMSDEVSHTPWAFLVMGISVAVSVARVRALQRSAATHDSQALEADALHFYTDIYTGGAVLVGLLGVWLGARFDIPWLVVSDAVAALIVTAVLLKLTVDLARRAADVLLDRSHELTDEIASAAYAVTGVEGVPSVRSRRVGPQSFVDMSIEVARGASFEESHAIATAVERAVAALLPSSDVVVHVDPVAPRDEGIVQAIHLLAQRSALSIHHISLHKVREALVAHLHVELDPLLTLSHAHQLVDRFEKTLLDEVGALHRVVIHIEPAAETVALGSDVTEQAQRITQRLDDLIATIPEIYEYHDLHLHKLGGSYHLSFHCCLPPTLSINAAHAITDGLERRLRDELPVLSHVLIHAEPWEGARKRRGESGEGEWR